MSFSSGKTFAESDFVALSSPELRGNEWKYLKECLDSGWVSSVGPFVGRFERDLAVYVGANHAVAVVNGTAALHTALRVVGVQPDEEVIVSNLTFVAPVNAISYCQAYPVLIDANPETWQIDVEKVARFLANECEVRGEACYNRSTGRRLRAILPVHILGLACEIDRILDLARQYHLLVVEDAAEALGVRYRGQQVGTFGDIGVFSFNGNKIVTAGGGGMLVTNNSTYADYARYLTTQAKDDPLEYLHHEIGYNYRLTNIQAALGVAQLEEIEHFIEKKRAIARYYDRALGKLHRIRLMPTPAHTDPTCWLYTILLEEEASLEERKTIIRKLNREGVGARPLWHTIHDLPPYRDCQAFWIEHSIRLYERGVSLPCSVGGNSKELERSVAVLAQALMK
jgi:perosamine synthetase